MDSNTSGALGILAFLVSAGGLVYTAINHKRIKCRCCGKDMDVSVDVDPTESAPKPEEEPIPIKGVRRQIRPPLLPPLPPIRVKNKPSRIVPQEEEEDEEEN